MTAYMSTTARADARGKKPDEHREIEIADEPKTVMTGDFSADNVRVRAIDTTMRGYFRGRLGLFATRYLEPAGWERPQRPSTSASLMGMSSAR
jgi:hypothetical protein